MSPRPARAPARTPSRPPARAAALPSRRPEWAAAAALLLATLVVYTPVLGQAFLNYDDDLYVTRNAALRLGLTAEGVRWAFTTGHGANWFPLTWLSWLLDYELFGLSPRAFHATSAGLHALAAAALLLTLARATGALGRSAFVAGVFALHPLHVESVAWVSARKDVLSGLLWMLAIAAYVAYARAPSVRRYFLVAAALALGLMAKPVLVTLPFVLMLLDYWPLARLQRADGGLDRGRVRAAVLEKLPLLALAAASSVVTYLVQKAGGAVEAGEVFPFWARLADASVSYVEYLRQAAWPRGLAVFYPHPGGSVSIPYAAAAFLALAAATLLALRGARARPAVAVGWLWYLGTLVPMLGLVQVGQQARADRYTYLPLVGIALAAAWGLAGPLGRWNRRLPAIAGTVAVAAFAAVTARQVRVWRDSETLFAHALGVTGENAVARLNLGIALLERQRPAEAEGHLREALRLHPLSAEAHGGLGEALARQGRPEEARGAFEAALRLDPTLARAHNGLARVLAERGEPGTAGAHLREAMSLDPAYAEPYNNLGALRLADGAAAEAIEYFRKAVTLEPAYAEAHANWGRALLARGETREAAERLRVAAQLSPNDAGIRASWAMALAHGGDLEGAAARFAEAVERNPDDGLAHAGLALALANQERVADALPHFERAAALRPRDAEALTGWGMALDAVGRSAEAAERFRAALALDPGYAEAHNALGIALGKQERFAEAERHFVEAVARRPEMAPAWNNWGLVLARRGRIADAIARFREAVARDPGYADAHNNLGVFLARRGRVEEARGAFEAALRAEPRHPDARANLERLAAARP